MDATTKDEIMQIYLETPFYGIRRITRELHRRGYRVNHKRIRRLRAADRLSPASFQYVGASSRAQKVSVPSEKSEDRPSEPGLGNGHHLHGGLRAQGIRDRHRGPITVDGFTRPWAISLPIQSTKGGASRTEPLKKHFFSETGLTFGQCLL